MTNNLTELSGWLKAYTRVNTCKSIYLFIIYLDMVINIHLYNCTLTRQRGHSVKYTHVISRSDPYHLQTDTIRVQSPGSTVLF